RSVTTFARHLPDAAPARLQDRGHTARQAARAVCRTLSGRVAAADRPGARPHRRAAEADRGAAGLSHAALSARADLHPGRDRRARAPSHADAGAGARARRRGRARLSLYRVDGGVETIDIALTLPSRDVAHIVRLIDLKLETLAAAEDAGFGFEAVGLA